MKSEITKFKIPRRSIVGLCLASLFMVLTSCEEDPAFNRQIDAGNIDDLVKQVGTYDDPEPGFPETEIPEEAIIGQGETASDGSQFVCNTRKYQKRTVIEQLTLAAFDDRTATNTASLYPGSIIKLNEYVNENDLTGIGGYERNPIQVSSTLGDIRAVEDPSQRGNVDKAIKEIEGETGSFAAQVQSEVTYAYSFEQAMLEFGLDASYMGNSVSSKFKTENTVEEKNIFIKFFQVYHTVSVPNPARPSELFGNSVSSSDLEGITGAGKPLGYVSEVAYGRMLIGQFTYRGTEFSSQVELEGEFNKGLANIKAETTIANASKFVNSTFKVSILGGDAEQASVVAGSGAGMEAVQAAFDFMKDGIGDASLGVPVQFKVRYLADNSLFAIVGAAE
ncbi:MAG: thiol-activated cytolysin family protein, partial [Cyclobacteriaceae bacterium]